MINHDPVSSPPPVAPSSWEIGEAMSTGVEGLRTHWRVLVPAMLVVSFLTEGLSLAMNSAGESLGGTAEGTLALASTGISLVLGAVLSAGMMQITLDTARGQKPRLASLVERADRALPLIGAYLLMVGAIFLGSLAFIIPGIIAAVGLSFAPMLVVDRKAAAGEALRGSWTLLDGHKAKLFRLGLVCTGLMLVTMLPFGALAMSSPVLGALLMMIPIFGLSIVMGIAQAWIYLRVSGE